MQGPFHYIEQLAAHRITLDDTLQSADKRELRATRAVAGFWAVAFTAMGVILAKDAIDKASEAITHEDSIVFQVVDDSMPAGEMIVAGVAGWTAVELASFVAGATKRVQELNHE